MTLKSNSWRSPVLLGLVLLFNAAGCGVEPEPPSTPPTLEQALASVCGNGLIEEGEGCDDSNTAAGDGCGAVRRASGS